MSRYANKKHDPCPHIIEFLKAGKTSLSIVFPIHIILMKELNDGPVSGTSHYSQRPWWKGTIFSSIRAAASGRFCSCRSDTWCGLRGCVLGHVQICYPKQWMVYIRKIQKNWMIWGYTPILGNHHMFIVQLFAVD